MLEVSSEDIASIVGSVCESTFGVDATAIETEANEGPVSSALVGITGEWDGAVLVDCTPELARVLAGTMFGIAADDVGRDQVEDTLGELANMIGGNLKALLPPPCSLSLPTVVEGRHYRVRVPGATTVRNLRFALPAGELRVIVAERGLKLVE